ncbi:GNAT family N-acetyltransferase [Streptomyces sp. NPDC048506]|uniref:GNAT family N-acetyltransferase n=1 Tax=Streptomyces sp. NPDC048506 TaxID=3155028 RepID=UPI003427F275
MTGADIDAVAAVRVHGWQAAYRGLMPQAYLDAMSVAEDAERQRSRFGRRPPEVSDLVAERDGGIIGWISVGPARDRDLAPGPTAPPTADRLAGEVYALYLAPGVIGTGVGRSLLAAGTARAGASGFRALYLWVLRGNARGRRFYERAGFVPDGAEEAYEVGGSSVPEVRYWRPLGPGPR